MLAAAQVQNLVPSHVLLQDLQSTAYYTKCIPITINLTLWQLSQ